MFHVCSACRAVKDAARISQAVCLLGESTCKSLSVAACAWRVSHLGAQCILSKSTRKADLNEQRMPRLGPKRALKMAMLMATYGSRGEGADAQGRTPKSRAVVR